MKTTKSFLIVASILGLILLLFIIWFFKAPSFPKSFTPPPPLQLPAPNLGKGTLFVEGKVVNPAGTGLESAWISAVGNRHIHSSRCAAEGKFQIPNLPEGPIEITAAAPGYRPAKITVNAGEGPVTIGLQSLSVYGDGPYPTAVPQNNRDILSRIACTGVPASSFAVALIPTSVKTQGGIRRAAVDTNGIFKIDSPATGSYFLRILSAPKSYNLEFFYKEIEINVGSETRCPDEISFGCMDVVGEVLAQPPADVFPAPESPLPCSNCSVTLRAKSGKDNWIAVETQLTNEEGKYEFLNLPENEYRVEANSADFEPFTGDISKPEGRVSQTKITLKPKTR